MTTKRRRANGLDELRRKIKVVYVPFDEEAARRAVRAFVNLFLSVRSNRITRELAETGRQPTHAERWVLHLCASRGIRSGKGARTQ